ncbi:MAG: hypothetical protein QOI74_3119 [Micromonosporaceae bacterium]|nr:hypothetical protein [Micromonosporaceae bacterium]MDT5035971.1 hypothetical protein [Micromonosporaceae bacterium]
MIRRTVGHYAPGMLATLVGSLIVLTLVPAASSYVAWQVVMVVFAVVIFLALSILAHNRHLCERCIAAMPLDAATVAGRYAVRFRVAHLFERKLFALCYLTTVVGSALLYFHPIARYGWAAVQASLIYLLLVYVTHQRLQPWCPHCRNGGQEQTTPTTPSPVTTGL